MGCATGRRRPYGKVARMKQELLQHSTFQFWYPTKVQKSISTPTATLTELRWLVSLWTGPKKNFWRRSFGECDHSPHFKELSAVKFDWWPLIIVACRHYRLPVPLHFLEDLRKTVTEVNSDKSPSSDSQVKPGKRNDVKRFTFETGKRGREPFLRLHSLTTCG